MKIHEIYCSKPQTLLSEEDTVSPTVYHGNQGGIHGELTAPMWWTEIKDDALLYVRQGGDIDMDGWLLTAKIKCKKPYTVGKNQEIHTVLAGWKELAEKGYDCIHDADRKDWIPLHSKDITLLDTEYVSAPDTKGSNWIRKVYDMFPEHPFDSNHRYIEFDEGDGVFELSLDDNTESGAVISFIQAYPHEHTPQAIDDLETKTIQKLQDLAQQNGVTLSKPRM